MRLYNSDCLKVLKRMEDNSIDSIVCDPPYGINIQSQTWDKELPNLEIWNECFRVLKPGGHIMAFSSARLYHHLAVAMETVGFDTFNMLTWIYGSGFPKGCNLSREFDRTNDIPKPDDKFRKYLKDAIKASPYRKVDLEKICGTTGMMGHYTGKSQPAYPSLKVWKILKKTLKLDSTYDDFFKELEKKRDNYRSSESSQHTARYFSSLKKDRSFSPHKPRTKLAKEWAGWKYGKQTVRPSMEPIYFGQKPPQKPLTRNIKEWGVGALNIQGCRTKEKDGKVRDTSSVLMEEAINDLLNEKDQGIANTISKISENDFFLESKPNRNERQGLTHPTLKPIALMQRLVRLVTPPNGVCLDPFMGSGTTGVACKREGINFVGIGREEDYFKMAKTRIKSPKLKLAA